MASYCGIKRPPAGKKRGTMEECLDKKQIRLYGLKEVPLSFLQIKRLSRQIIEKQDVKTSKLKFQIVALLKKYKKATGDQKKKIGAKGIKLKNRYEDELEILRNMKAEFKALTKK